MRNNIIALIVFVVFVGSVLTLGYVVSGDDPALHSRNSQPQYGNLNAGKVVRQGQDDKLALSQYESSMPSAGSSVSGYTMPDIHRSQGSSGPLYAGSQGMLNSYGGGQSSQSGTGSIGGTGGRNGNAGVAGSSNAGSGSIAGVTTINRKRNTSPSLATTPNSTDQPMTTQDKDYQLQAVNEDPDDPFWTPVGELPIALLLLFAGIYCRRAKRQK